MEASSTLLWLQRVESRLQGAGLSPLTPEAAALVSGASGEVNVGRT